MIKESKSMFAKRIGRDVRYVSKLCANGRLPTDERGFIIVGPALIAYAHRPRRGRPKKHGALVKVVVRVRPGQSRKIKSMANILAESE